MTGQESEDMESEQTMQHSSVAQAEISPANGDHPPCSEVGHHDQEEFETGGGMKEEEEEEEGVLEKWEEEFDFDDDDEDSDNGLKIYAV